MRILDVGAGDGTNLDIPDDAELVTLDLYAPADVKMDLTSHEFQVWNPDPFDVVVASHVMEHLPIEHQIPVYDKLAQLLAQGGTLHIMVPDLASLADVLASDFIPYTVMIQLYGSQADDGQYHKFGYNAQTLRGHLVSTGLEIVSIVREPFEISLTVVGKHTVYQTVHLHGIARKK